MPHKTPTAHRGRIYDETTPPCGVLEGFLLHLLRSTSPTHGERLSFGSVVNISETKPNPQLPTSSYMSSFVKTAGIFFSHGCRTFIIPRETFLYELGVRGLNQRDKDAQDFIQTNSPWSSRDKKTSTGGVSGEFQAPKTRPAVQSTTKIPGTTPHLLKPTGSGRLAD